MFDTPFNTPDDYYNWLDSLQDEREARAERQEEIAERHRQEDWYDK